MRTVFAWVLAAAAASGAAWAQGVPVDGIYDGTASIEGSATGRAAQGRCPQTIPFKLRVTDRAFLWRLPTSQATVPIGPDGSFAAQNAGRFISGRVSGGHLQAQTTGRGCNYIWSFDRQ